MELSQELYKRDNGRSCSELCSTAYIDIAKSKKNRFKASVAVTNSSLVGLVKLDVVYLDTQ